VELSPRAFKQTPTSRQSKQPGVYRDGNMLVLTLSHHAKPHPMLENGMPIWAVVCAVVDGDTMKVAQMLERSQTIKRGAGSRQN
jgi:hypothetical protein